MVECSAGGEPDTRQRSWQHMAMKPKGERANVRDIETAKSRGGRPSGLGYDPATGEVHQTGNPEFDALALTGAKGYDERRFYTKSTDQNGHGEKLQVRVPQGIDSQVYAAVREVVEYRHVNDFIRDAIVHRLEFLQKRYGLSDETRRFLELERLTANSERRSHDIDVMTATVAGLADKLKKAWDANDFGMLAKELEEGEELLEWVREPYYTRIKTVLTDWRRTAKERIEEYHAKLDD